jgi:hypothetical protein
MKISGSIVMKSLKTLLPVLVFVTASLFSIHAEAGLIGSTVTASNTSIILSPADSAVVGNGAEFTGPTGSNISFDFSDDQLTIQRAFGSPTNYTFPSSITFTFSNLNNIEITEVQLIAFTYPLGTVWPSQFPSDLSFNRDSITLPLTNVPLSAGSYFQFSIVTAASSTDIPEPFIPSLMGAGLFALAMAHRRKIR